MRPSSVLYLAAPLLLIASEYLSVTKVVAINLPIATSVFVVLAQYKINFCCSVQLFRELTSVNTGEEFPE